MRKLCVGVLSTVDDAFAKAGRNYNFPSAFIVIEYDLLFNNIYIMFLTA